MPRDSTATRCSSRPSAPTTTRPRAGQARLKASLERLELELVDLYLIHWPVPSRDRYVETWQAFIELQRDGLVRSIGVSNFQPAHLERLIDETGVDTRDEPGRAAPLLPAAGLRAKHASSGS